MEKSFAKINKMLDSGSKECMMMYRSRLGSDLNEITLDYVSSISDDVGKFVAIDIIEKISSMGALLSSNTSNITKNETERYRKFLKAELDKLSEKTKKKGKQIKIE